MVAFAAGEGMRSLAAFVLVLAFATHAHAQTCTVGVRCGNTCISRDDVCRVDDSRSGGGEGDPTLVYVVIGSLAVFAVASLVVAAVLTTPDDRGCFGLPFCAPPLAAPPAASAPDDAHPEDDELLRPDIVGLTIEDNRAFWGCLDRICAGNVCRAELAASLQEAHDKMAWLVERKCVARPEAPEVPFVDRLSYDEQVAFESCLTRLCPVDGSEAPKECSERQARSLALAKDQALWLSARECR